MSVLLNYVISWFTITAIAVGMCQMMVEVKSTTLLINKVVDFNSHISLTTCVLVGAELSGIYIFNNEPTTIKTTQGVFF